MKLSALVGRNFDPDPEIIGVTSDSRAVKPGFLFAAIPGLILDGANFIPQAEKYGAAAILAAQNVRSKLPTYNSAEPRRTLAEIASRFFVIQPDFIAGITGTNGKTSTAIFAAQIWALLGRVSGSLGTLGASGGGVEIPLVHTTPEPVTLHHSLAKMSEAKVTHLAMEVSSHGLAQHRADGVRFSAAAFTNLSQDHLDYHISFADYLAAKKRLFTELLQEDGLAVINIDGAGADEILEGLTSLGRRVMTTGKGGNIDVRNVTPQPDGLAIEVVVDGGEYSMVLPLIGAFQAENVLLAAGLVIGSGVQPKNVMAVLPKLSGVPGRMMLTAKVDDRAVYVDYAHTPEAVETALKAIRPHANGRVIVIVGAGGDRDKSKRRLMGTACLSADFVIVTDDNPRSEDPASIRAEILKGCPGAEEVGDRSEAIARGVAMLQNGDVLLVAGKGHETGQIVGDTTLPFDDAEMVRASMAALGSNG